ncbi:hypothetical protein ML5_5959 [Micromonospora sp. L5]|nr:hypothetical protein ML5_5959 [Micromonospora sp. L5]
MVGRSALQDGGRVGGDLAPHLVLQHATTLVRSRGQILGHLGQRQELRQQLVGHRRRGPAPRVGVTDHRVAHEGVAEPIAVPGPGQHSGSVGVGQEPFEPQRHSAPGRQPQPRNRVLPPRAGVEHREQRHHHGQDSHRDRWPGAVCGREQHPTEAGGAQGAKGHAEPVLSQRRVRGRRPARVPTGDHRDDHRRGAGTGREVHRQRMSGHEGQDRVGPGGEREQPDGDHRAAGRFDGRPDEVTPAPPRDSARSRLALDQSAAQGQHDHRGQNEGGGDAAGQSCREPEKQQGPDRADRAVAATAPPVSAASRHQTISLGG